jgi:peptidoglycan/xylan/chitin deacetylase (PgdA/CDA1 family)
MRRKEVLVRLIEAIGLARVLRPWLGGMGAIFGLHRVASSGSEVIDPDLVARADFLDAALTAVQRAGCRLVSLDEMAAALRDRHRNSARIVAFTFDDGYRDNATEALPVFQAHNAPMAIYLTTGLIDRSIDYWWGALERLVWRHDWIEARAIGMETDFPSATTEEKRHALASIQAWTHAYLEARAPKITAWCQARGISAVAAMEEDVLSWDEVRGLARNPLVTIGAHTVTHPRLSQLAESDARRELYDARVRIESEISRPVIHLAYPYGGRRACGPREAVLAREAGYETAVTTRRGNLFKSHSEHFTALPRQRMEGCPDLHQIRWSLDGLSWILHGGPRISRM